MGSAAACRAVDGSRAVDLFIPSYELNKLHAFRLTRDELDGGQLDGDAVADTRSVSDTKLNTAIIP